jgi:hypothetical protein
MPLPAAPEDGQQEQEQGNRSIGLS